MARRIDVRALIKSRFVHELPLVVAGCALAALAIDMFMVPQGLAAGGVTGLATIIAELTRTYNRVRQASITTEINEIVGGAAALEEY